MACVPLRESYTGEWSSSSTPVLREVTHHTPRSGLHSASRPREPIQPTLFSNLGHNSPLWNGAKAAWRTARLVEEVLIPTASCCQRYSNISCQDDERYPRTAFVYTARYIDRMSLVGESEGKRVGDDWSTFDVEARLVLPALHGKRRESELALPRFLSQSLGSNKLSSNWNTTKRPREVRAFAPYLHFLEVMRAPCRRLSHAYASLFACVSCICLHLLPLLRHLWRLSRPPDNSV